MASKHIIKKQVIELEMPQSIDRADIQNRVSRIYQQEVVPLLDKLLSNKSASSTLIIDHLEINIGRIPAGRLEQVLAERIGKALQESLDKMKTPAVPEAGVVVKPTVSKQENHTDAELVVYFLQTGVFPWWAQETSYIWLEKAFRSVLQQNSSNFKSAFITLLQDEAVVKRLVYTFDEVLLTQAAEQLIGISLAALLLQNEQLFLVFAKELSVQQLREYWWLSVYQTITSASIHSEEYLFERAGNLFVHLAAQKSNRIDLIQYLQNDKTGTRISEKITGFINQSLTDAIREQKAFDNNDLAEGSSKANKTDHNRVIGNPLLKDIDKTYVLNAGLVLLWPFLHRFFQNMSLADDRTFTNENNAEHACLLLQYLATGSTEGMFEAQLPLNKILCGVPLLQPVNTQWTISDEEKEIADNFLLAVIQNGGAGWKNLSISGMRQAYLNREGIISGRDGNWLLQVKRETYDILVDRLPWTVQVVKLPWMERLLFVEWQVV